jgi:ATP-dependent RNA helicase RhlE
MYAPSMFRGSRDARRVCPGFHVSPAACDSGFPRDLSDETAPLAARRDGLSAGPSTGGNAPCGWRLKDVHLTTDKMFSDLGVAEYLCRALAADGYTKPTPIQERSIPTLLEGRDLLGIAETGTGKTASFALPILQKLAALPGRPQSKAPRALILAPTRELAVQILDSFKSYGRHAKLTFTAIFGGVGQGAQVQAMIRGVDVLVATPGRLLDLCQQRHVDLSKVSILVLDEADRMLDMGFVRDVRKIVAMVPKERQTLLFSATMPQDIGELAAEILKNPAKVEIARAGKTVDRIDQSVHHVQAAAKRELLTKLLADPAMSRVIVFTRTKRGANKVSEQLDRAGISSDAIHGNKSQNARQRALDEFRTGRIRVLVATDIAARGLDIDNVTHVINYELPDEPESYVHRIGRTARAGTDGIAIAFCAPDERENLRDIERLIRRPLTVVGSPPGGQHHNNDALEALDEAPSRRPEGGRQGRPGQQRGGRGGEQRQGQQRQGEGRQRQARRGDDPRQGRGESRGETRGEGRGHSGQGASPSRGHANGQQEPRARAQERSGGNSSGRAHPAAAGQGQRSGGAGGPTPWAAWSGRR